MGNNLEIQTIADEICGLSSALINTLGNKEKNESLEEQYTEAKDGKNRETNSKVYNEVNTQEKICLKKSTQLLEVKNLLKIII